MEISLMVAASENNVIGKEGGLPWHLPKDLKFFKQTTLGHPVVMGRKTFASFGGKPLPGRLNVILSRTLSAAPEGTVLYRTLTDALEALKKDHPSRIFIIGGGEVFARSWEMAERLYLTRVHTKIEDGDAFIPPVAPQKWQLQWQEHHPADEKHAFAFTFQEWSKLPPAQRGSLIPE